MGFPLLNLDFLVIEEVLKNFDPVELFDFSLISKCTKLLVKSSTLHLNNIFKIDIDISDDFRIDINQKNGPDDECWRFLIKGPGPRALYEHRLITSLDFPIDDDVERFKFCLDYVQNLFKIPEIDAFYNLDFSSNFCHILDWLKTRQDSIVYAQVVLEKEIGQPVPDRDISDALDMLSRFSIKELDLVMSPSQQWVNNDRRDYEWNNLVVSGAYWLTLPRLLTMDCKEMEVFGTSLTSKDLNTFLKWWMAGSHQKVRQWNLTMKSLDMNLVLEGIPGEDREPDLVRTYICDTGYEEAYRGGFDIRRSDGTTATVIRDSLTFKFQVWQI